MRPKVYVSLIIVDEKMDPSEITRLPGIEPYRIWHNGEIRPKTNILEKESGWELKSPLPPEITVIEHVSSLLSAIEHSIPRLKEFTLKHKALLACAIYFQDELPEIHLDAGTTRLLADLNLALDVDLYGVE